MTAPGPAAPLVLVVEDDAASAELCAEVLGDDARVHRSGTLAAALAAAEHDRPDCFVLDLGLPDATGLEGVRAIAASYPDVPVVVLTGNRDEGLVEQAMREGADDYVHKDALLEQLARAAGFAVSRARRRRLVQQTVREAQSVLAALPDGVVVLDADGRIASVNDAALEVLGATAGALTGASLAAAPVTWLDATGAPIAPADVPWRHVVSGEASEHSDHLGCRQADGSLRWLDVDARSLHADTDEVYAVVLCLRDVTERHAEQTRSRFQAALLDAVGQAVIATDADGTVVYWNTAAERLYGWSAAEAVGRSIMELTPSEASVEQAEEIMTALRAGLTWTGDFPVRRRDGGAFYALVSNTPLLAEDGTVVGVIGASMDITARKHAEEQARRLSAVVDSTGDAVVLSSLDGVVLSWNHAAERLYGWPADQAVGHGVALVAPDDRVDEVQRVLAEVARGATVRDLETTHRRADGALVEVSVTVSPVYDDTGTVTAASAIARDISERRDMERALERAALHDSLTGLPNRTLLGDRLEQAAAVCERDGEPLAVLFLDLDDFKAVNDGAGHVLGDAVLVHVAAQLRAHVRPGDTVARFGGDEFVVVCPGAGREKALDIAQRLLTAVRAPLDVDGRRLYASSSIGVAISPPAATSALLARADAAVYDAKARGRGQVVEYASALSAQAEQRLALSGDLREAIEADGLRLVFQPIVDLRTGEALGVEALARWDHAELGAVSPAVFVPVAEQTGLGRDLDSWVLHRACAEFAGARRDGVVPLEAYLSVNVSADSVVDSQFHAIVLEALATADLPPSSLVVEVTETGVVGDLDAAVRTLTALSEVGIRVAIDDFGTGWSSLTYVRRLPASILKLDRTFVARVHEDDDDLAIAASVIDLGRATGLTVVAEGVEVAEQLAVLRRLGCSAGQGWLWHAAVPMDALADALATVAERRVPTLPAARTPALRSPALDVAREHGLDRLRELHAQGASLATIAAALNKDGFRNPHGQRWHARSVARVVAGSALGSLPVTPG